LTADAVTAPRPAAPVSASDISPGQELAAWFQTPPGRYLLAWEQRRFDQAVADAFGYHALQIGLPELATLDSNRMPHRWLGLPEPPAAVDGADGAAGRAVDLVMHAAALPFAADSLDLVTLPHTLELSADPHAVLREVARVLVPNGLVVISGLNPLSWWGWRQGRAHLLSRLGLGHTRLGRRYLPQAGAFIASWRLRDWLRLLSFEVTVSDWGCYRPPVRSERWLQRTAWLDRVGQRWWPPLGAVYFLVAVKRLRGMHLLGPAWRPTRASAASAVVARRDRQQPKASP
jgi:SAM-dependent methyltransferase